MQVALLQSVCQRSSFRTCTERLCLRSQGEQDHSQHRCWSSKTTYASVREQSPYRCHDRCSKVHVHLANRIILAESGERVLNIPLSTRTFGKRETRSLPKADLRHREREGIG